jgi:hypothetical protein
MKKLASVCVAVSALLALSPAFAGVSNILDRTALHTPAQLDSTAFVSCIRAGAVATRIATSAFKESKSITVAAHEIIATPDQMVLEMSALGLLMAQKGLVSPNTPTGVEEISRFLAGTCYSSEFYKVGKSISLPKK